MYFVVYCFIWWDDSYLPLPACWIRSSPWKCCVLAYGNSCTGAVSLLVWLLSVHPFGVCVSTPNWFRSISCLFTYAVEWIWLFWSGLISIPFRWCRFGTKIDWWSRLSHMSVVSSKLVFWLKIVCTSSSSLLRVLRSLLVNSPLLTIISSIKANSNQWILIFRSEFFFLSRATGVRPTACHPLRSWPASARAADGLRFAPTCPRRAGSRYWFSAFKYLLSTLALLAPLLLPTWPTVSRVRSSLAPLYYILTGLIESANSFQSIVLWTPLTYLFLTFSCIIPWAYTNPLGFCPVCFGVSYFVVWNSTPFYSCMLVILVLVILLLLEGAIVVLLGVLDVLYARRVRLEAL